MPSPTASSRSDPHEVEDEIVRLRKQLADAGLDAGAETIVAHLQRSGVDPVPATSTVWRILTRPGLVDPQPQKRPKSSFTRFEADQPNVLWQADTTHWQLADGTDVEICNILDDHSRLAIAAVARTTFKAPDVVAVFTDGFDRYGLPAAVLTDNGAIFAGAPRGGRVALEKHLDLLGIRVIHSRPYHPQTCGKVEQFHQTLKKWLRAQEPAEILAQLQTRLDTFRDTYNNTRPHRALGRRTPAEAYTARSKAGPDGALAATHWRIRRDVVDTTGVVTLRRDSRLHHTGTRITMLVDDLHIRIVTLDGELLRELILDTSRDYQPTGRPPGPPPRNPPPHGTMSRDR